MIFYASSTKNASSVCMFVYHYVTNAPINVTMCNKTITTFEWYSSDNSYKLWTASDGADGAQIFMNVYLAYTNSKYC
ncbi:MAG: hypothetical protein RXR43_14845 [Sulfolobus sp.]